MLPMLYVRLTIKVKAGIAEGFKVGWYPHKITGSSHLKKQQSIENCMSRLKMGVTFCTKCNAICNAQRARSAAPWVRKFGYLCIIEI